MSHQLKPSVCIDAVLGDLNPTDAVQIVADAGIDAFEFWQWWDKDLDQIAAIRDKHSMQISACCTKFISLVDPAMRAEYLTGLEESIAAAQQLKCKTLISQVGDFRPGVSRDEQHQSLVDGLRQAAPMLQSGGVTLVIEPLNELIDHAGYYLVRSDEAFEIIDKVGSPAVKVVFDIYHQQISEGQLIANITANIDKIGHFHAAGNPGRNELTRGELHYPSIFQAIQQTNYDGYVGLEYWPVDDALAGLREVASWFPSVV
ncbi:MAG: TIM barrel protein [Pirellulaceae bacterium]|nr:TIM barrel protein [Pirellulaceae bacterium]